MMRTARKQTIPNKLYFRIGEVSDIVGVKPYVLRYWETEFGDVRPTKSKSGQRLYKRRDVELLMAVKTLLYEERYTIDGAKQRLRETARGDAPAVIAPSGPETSVAARSMVEEELPFPVAVSAASTASNGREGTASAPHPIPSGSPEPAPVSPLSPLGPRRVRETLASRRLLLKLREGLQEILDDLHG